MLFFYIVEALLTAGFASCYPVICHQNLAGDQKNAGSLLRQNKNYSLSNALAS
jgi:hypothetical protein